MIEILVKFSKEWIIKYYNKCLKIAIIVEQTALFIDHDLCITINNSIHNISKVV